MKECSLKFTQLSKHDPTVVADSRAKMNKFVMGVSHLLLPEYGFAMLIQRLDTYRLMVHAEQIKEQNLKKVVRELKR